MKAPTTLLLLAMAAVAAAALPSPTSSSARGLLIAPRGGAEGNRWVSPRARYPMAMAHSRRGVARGNRYRPGSCAAQFGGDVVSDTIFGGFHNFLALYNLVLTGRILLSWFPNIARQPVFEPLFVVTNPFFNIFRGLIPPIGGIDLSPLPAFFLLSFLTNATESLGADLPNKNGKANPGAAGRRGPANARMAAAWNAALLKQREALARLPKATLPSLALPADVFAPAASNRS